MTYDYKCDEHGYFTVRGVPLSEHKAPHPCPVCDADSKRVILTAPVPLVEAMADAGCPGAMHTSGDRMEKRHRDAGQYHVNSENAAAEARAIDRELQYKATTTSAE